MAEADGPALRCRACGAERDNPAGQCPTCSEWCKAVRPVLERREVEPRGVRRLGEADWEEDRIPTGLVDPVLGGGIVEGSILHLCGEPGAGKSTLLLQLGQRVQRQGYSVLYSSGEESAGQVRERAERVGGTDLPFLSTRDLGELTDAIYSERPDLLVLDSLQTLVYPGELAMPGTVHQVRRCGSALTRLGKDMGLSQVWIGHLTKAGEMAGPKETEHLVDVVLFLQGDREEPERRVRAVKNRYGRVGPQVELEMTGSGLEPVAQPLQEVG